MTPPPTISSLSGTSVQFKILSLDKKELPSNSIPPMHDVTDPVARIIFGASISSCSPLLFLTSIFDDDKTFPSP